MQLTTNFVYNDPLLVKHIQPLKTVNNIKYLCVSRNSLECKCITCIMKDGWGYYYLSLTDYGNVMLINLIDGKAKPNYLRD